MIEVKLLVEEYCNNCPHLSPCTDNIRYYDDDFNCGHEILVMCKYKEHCGYLMNHLSKKDGGK